MENSYEINVATLALIPISENLTQVIELDDSFYVADSLVNIIDNSCRLYGSTFNGRSEGAKSLIGITYKVPIVVSESKNIIIFPTGSLRNNEFPWLALNNIADFEKKKRKTIVKFENNQELELDISSFSLENQIYKATMLESKIRKLANA